MVFPKSQFKLQASRLTSGQELFIGRSDELCCAPTAVFWYLCNEAHFSFLTAWAKRYVDARKVEHHFFDGGGFRTALAMNVPFLGRIPFDPKMVECADAGESYLEKYPDSEVTQAYNQIVATIMEADQTKISGMQSVQREEKDEKEETVMKIAVPVAEGRLTAHFGHAAEFAIVHVENQEIKKKELLTPPRHEPGVLPRWLHELGVGVIMAGGMGQRALALFGENGIKVIPGAPSLTPEELVHQYLGNTLVTGDNVCDH